MSVTDLVVPPGLEELVARIQAIDTGALTEVAGALETGARQVEFTCLRMRGIANDVYGQEQWAGAAGSAWYDHLYQGASTLSQAEYALREMAGILRELVGEAERAKATLRQVGPLAAELYKNPTNLTAKARAEQLIESACNAYHSAEKRLRDRLWRLGDSANVGDPPLPPAPLQPKPSWWEWLLGLYPEVMWSFWPKDGKPYGVNEDGELVPAHWGMPIPMEVQEMGIGGLLRVIPRLARRVKVTPGMTADDIAKQLADDIAGSYGWRPGHIDRHIREWYGLGKDEPVPAWMKAEFLHKVSTAAARSGKVIPSRLGGQDMHAVLHYDQATKRYLAVYYHASGKYAGEFATAFRPTPAQVDELLRRGATIKGF